MLRPETEPMKQRLVDPDDHPGSDVVIYDGECVFCRGAVNQLQRLDCCGTRLSYLSLHDPRVSERYPDLTHDQLMQQMYVVASDRSRHGGADAVRYLSRRLPLLWWSAPVLHLPGTANLWRWLYGLVARQRYRIAGRDCDSGGCRV